MKKMLLLAAVVAFGSPATFAQGVQANNASGAKTTVKVRDNGTVRTESRTGRTDAGQVAYDAKEGTKHAAHKTAHVVDKGAHKTGHAVKKGAKAVKKEVKKIG